MEEVIKKNNKVKATSTKKVTALKTNVKPKSLNKTEKMNPADPYPITLNKQEERRVIELFKGTKTISKTPVSKIAEVLKINKKQVFRVLHKNQLKTYKESSLK
jgi:hypothetical protein